MREVTVKWAGGAFAQDVEVAGHRIRADEEVTHGGDNTGAEPHELLLAALGSCTAMTLKAYAERKAWPLTDARVRLTGESTSAGFVINKQLTLDGDLTAEQRQRLLEIADKCPVQRTLSGSISIRTTAIP